ncbi:MAG: alkaline phosphatase family protein [Micrococcales bacterium]|nr:alkaline phosphatase family protein [Micrococcales bacterium]
MSTMLPSPPKSLGALAAVQGESNALGLSSKKSICVVMVDGLGFYNLKDAAGHARHLNSLHVEKASCYFPATTSTSLTSFATGKRPDETGFYGYNLFDRSTGQAMNLLSGWVDQESARSFQRLTTVSETAKELGIELDVISQSTYQDTGLTAATMPAAKFRVAESIESRFEKATQVLKQSEHRVIYLYIPELDQTAHHYGAGSNKWIEQVELLDSLVGKFLSELPSHAGVIITADHGVIDVKEQDKIFMDEVIRSEELLFVGGDTRGLMIYLKDQSRRQDKMEVVKSVLGDSCYVFEIDELLSSGYWRSSGDRPELLPDFWIVARKNVALYHRAFSRPKSLRNIGHHGGFSERELTIPLIRVNC